MANRILIIAMNKHWVGIARLPEALHRAGFLIYALAPNDSYIAHTKFLNDSILFKCFSYTRSKIIYLFVLFSFFKFKPDFVIPGDEEATFVLQRFSSFCLNFPFLNKIGLLVRNSLPSSKFDEMIFSKSEFLKNCEKWNISTPKSIEVKTREQAIIEANLLNYPIVLKLDAGYGGSGVFVCQNEDDLIKNFSSQKKLTLFIHFKHLLKNLFFVNILDKELKISVQEFIEGQPGHISFFSFRGKMLAANPMLAIHTYPGKTGPSSVSTGFNYPLLFKFASIVAEKTQYNGFGALDFMYDKIQDKVFVIEMNARPTPPSHLNSKIVPNDLCSLLYKSLNQEKIEINDFSPYTIAMFPYETKRDPQSEYLKTAFHDIPQDDPRLVHALLNF